MNKNTFYVIIALTICLIVMAFCIPFLIKNGNYSTIISASIPLAIVVIYLISKNRNNNDHQH